MTIVLIIPIALLGIGFIYNITLNVGLGSLVYKNMSCPDVNIVKIN